MENNSRPVVSNEQPLSKEQAEKLAAAMIRSSLRVGKPRVLSSRK